MTKRMKKILIGVFVFCASLLLAKPFLNFNSSEITQDSSGIQFFHGSFDELLLKAKKENKPIFVDAFATWCGPCKSLSKNVFTQKEVGDYFNANFINYKITVEDNKGATPEGRLFVQKYSLDAYPTMFFLSPDGSVLNKIVGLYRPEGLIKEGGKALSKFK